MNWCWRKILVMPVLTCFFSTSISDNTKFSEMKPGERTKAYKISSVKNFCREKGPIEHEDMATRTHSISFWTDQNFRFSVSLNPYTRQCSKLTLRKHDPQRKSGGIVRSRAWTEHVTVQMSKYKWLFGHWYNVIVHFTAFLKMILLRIFYNFTISWRIKMTNPR